MLHVAGVNRRSFGAALLAAAYPGATAEDLRSYLTAQIDAGEIPGAFVQAVRNGGTILQLHLGTYCDRGHKGTPCSGSAIYPFFSVSKMISATAVVMAWQEGLIDIDVPVMKYIPEFGNRGKDRITIRHLLTHSAGIPKMPPAGPADTGERWKAAVAAVCALPLEWEPGSRTEYHGQTGMLISAEAVRRVSNRMSWNEICSERIFRPLGLGSFSFLARSADAPLAVIPQPKNAAAWRPQSSGFTGYPAAGLSGTAADLLKFLKFETDGGVWNGKRLLKEKYWAEMHRPQFRGKHAPKGGKPGFESWGLGMMVRGNGPRTAGLGWFGIRDQDASPRLFSHAGIDTVLALGDPDADLQAVFIATDSPTTKAKAGELRNTVTERIYGTFR